MVRVDSSAYKVAQFWDEAKGCECLFLADCVEKVPSTEVTKIRAIQIDTYIRLLLPSQFALERPTSRRRSAMRPPRPRFRKRFHDAEKIWLAMSSDFFNTIGPSRLFAAVQRSVWNLRRSGHRQSNADDHRGAGHRHRCRSNACSGDGAMRQ
jgi:hypothetical protein